MKDWAEPGDLTAVRRLRELASDRAAGDTLDSDIAAHLRQMPTLARLGHPLVRAFDDQFRGDDDAATLRQTISSVADRQWYKQTYSARWRGAAVLIEADGVETAWLGAAGYHRAGSPEDFYARFARECAAGSDGFLPGPEDDALRKVELKAARRDAWMLQVHLTALVLLHAALQDREIPYAAEVLTPDGRPLLSLEMTVVTSIADGVTVDELVVEVRPEGWEHVKLCDVATRVVCSAIDPQKESWVDAPLDGPAMSHWTVLTEDAKLLARIAAESGELDAAARPGEVRLGTRAHFARRDNLTRATVEGEAVHAMCGHWFVPTADHEHLPKCETCHDRYHALPE